VGLPPPTASDVEALVARVRQRHRARVEELRAVAADQRRLEKELFPPPPQEPSLWDRLWGSLGARPPDDPEVTRLERLEEQIEVGHQLVVRLAHHLDTLRLTRAALRQEQGQHEALARRCDEASARAEAEGRPSDAALHRRVGSRLRAVGQLLEEGLAAEQRVADGMGVLYDAATEALDAIDHQLARAAAEARARDLAAVLHGAGPLHDAVQRVRRLAGENHLVVDGAIDRLSREVDLLAPVDPAALAAEAEVVDFLREG